MSEIIEKPVDISAPRIVCAANKHFATGELAIGVRHFCPLMNHNIQLFIDRHEAGENSSYDLGWRRAEQGFIDQHGRFYSRKAAWRVADTNNQIIRDRDWQTGSLHSEHIY